MLTATKVEELFWEMTREHSLALTTDQWSDLLCDIIQYVHADTADMSSLHEDCVDADEYGELKAENESLYRETTDLEEENDSLSGIIADLEIDIETVEKERDEYKGMIEDSRGV